jgi:hypothetical protein
MCRALQGMQQQRIGHTTDQQHHNHQHVAQQRLSFTVLHPAFSSMQSCSPLHWGTGKRTDVPLLRGQTQEHPERRHQISNNPLKENPLQQNLHRQGAKQQAHFYAGIIRVLTLIPPRSVGITYHSLPASRNSPFPT